MSRPRKKLFLDYEAALSSSTAEEVTPKFASESFSSRSRARRDRPTRAHECGSALENVSSTSFSSIVGQHSIPTVSTFLYSHVRSLSQQQNSVSPQTRKTSFARFSADNFTPTLSSLLTQSSGIQGSVIFSLLH